VTDDQPTTPARRGKRPSGPVTVVGFDDVPVAAWIDPPLTTVHQPLSQMAATAAELALVLGRGEETPQLGVELVTTLTVRESTAPPRARRAAQNSPHE
jgi:DNA-binding LacI/PurR family transcriptional regulator